MKKMMRYLLIVLGCLMAFSCGRPTLEEYREEGRGITKNLIKALQKVHTREKLQASSTKLQKLFDEMATVMIAAQELKQKKMGLEAVELTKEDHELSDRLRFELNRLYYIEGGRTIIEKAQEKGLKRLEAYEKSRKINSEGGIRNFQVKPLSLVFYVFTKR